MHILRLALCLMAALLISTSSYAEGAAKGKGKIAAQEAAPAPVSTSDDLIDTVKKFKPYIAAYAGVAASYGDGKAPDLAVSDGGFDAAALGGGAIGFTSRLSGTSLYWGLEVNAERRMVTEDSTPLSQYFKGGELKYTAAIDAVLGTALTERSKVYAKVGYRWGWSEDMIGLVSKTTFEVPTKAGWEAGLGFSHNITNNLVWDLNAMMWFIGDESAAGTKLSGPVKLEGSDVTVRTGLKFEF